MEAAIGANVLIFTTIQQFMHSKGASIQFVASRSYKLGALVTHTGSLNVMEEVMN